MLTRFGATPFKPVSSARELGCGGWEGFPAEPSVSLVPPAEESPSELDVVALEMSMSGRFRTNPRGSRRGFPVQNSSMTPISDSRFSPVFAAGIGCNSCNKTNGFPTTLELQAQEIEDQRQMVGLGCSKCKRTRKQALLIYEMEGRKRRVVMGQVCPIQSVDPSTVNCQRTSTGDIVCSNGFIYSGDCPMAPQPNLPGVAEDVNGIPKIPPPPGAEMVSPSPEPAPSGAPSASSAAPAGVPPLVVGAAAVGGIAILLSILS